MIDFLLAPENIPFASAIAIVVFAFVLEVAMSLAGASIGQTLEGLLPDFDAVPGPLEWLGFGRVPFFVILISFVTTFGLVGYGIQATVSSVGLGLLPSSVAWFPALVVAAPVSGKVSLFLSKIIPRDETYVGSLSTVVGSIGKITIGEARSDLPAECKVPDGHGGHHYVRAVPDREGDVIPAGTKVIVVGRDGDIFRVACFADPED